MFGLLGSAGMGEVYRAHDLKLEQQVALKFLPEAAARNPRLLERFRGEVRIARQISHRNVCREVSVRSDIYSLGLVMAEMFTGQRPSQDAKLSVTTKDLDPSVEKVIQRCLDPDPARRPASALDVARALPGGDPLAEALAAGDTPSPEMVAASEDTGALSIRSAVLCLAFIAAGIAGAMILKSNWLSATVVVLLAGLINFANQASLIPAAFTAVQIGAGVAILVRFGILPMVLAIFVSSILPESPLTTDFSAWYANSMFTALAIVLTITLWSFRATLGGRTVWKGDFLEGSE